MGEEQGEWGDESRKDGWNRPRWSNAYIMVIWWGMEL